MIKKNLFPLILPLSFAIFITFALAGCKDKPNNNGKDLEIKTNEAPSSTNNLKEEKKYILFYGNSLTAGYGLEENQSFPALIQNRIDSLGMPYKVINGGLSGETSSGGLERINWVLQQEVNIFVLELGANDMLRGLDLKATEENLQKILDEVKSQYPEAALIIAGMQAPPNMGPDYVESFTKIFKKLSDQYNATLIPFILEGVAGIESLNLEDRKHPNIQGQKIVMENVWEALEPLL